METHKVILLIMIVVLALILLGIIFIPRLKKNGKHTKSTVTLEFTDVDDEELDSLYISHVDNAATRQRAKVYCDRFLNKKIHAGRSQVYISTETYERVRYVLPLIDPEISQSAFISNILNDHLDEYRKEMRIISENNYKKTMESWNTPSNS